MSRVNANSSLRVEDYPAEERKWLPRLFQPLNLLLTQIVGAINGNIEFGSNIPSQDDNLEFNYSGSFPSYKWGLVRPPKFQLLGRCLEDGVQVSLVLTTAYDASSALVNVTSIFKVTATGSQALQSGSLYKVSIRTMA